MARIRTIKPDFWTDEKIVELAFEARLFFIGSWNFADDNGNLQRSAKKLKMQIFPADAIDCEPIIQSLITHGLLTEYHVNGETFLHIKGFKQHQVINRPSKTGLPSIENATTPARLTESSLTEGNGYGREGNGKEGKGMDVCTHEPSSAAKISLVMRRYSIPANPSHPSVIALAEQGVDLETLEAACLETREAKPNEAIAVNYIVKKLEGWKRQVDGMNVRGASRPPPQRSYHDERADTIAGLTGRSQRHEHNDNVIDIPEQQLARLAR